MAGEISLAKILIKAERRRILFFRSSERVPSEFQQVGSRNSGGRGERRPRKSVIAEGGSAAVRAGRSCLVKKGRGRDRKPSLTDAAATADRRLFVAGDKAEQSIPPVKTKRSR